MYVFTCIALAYGNYSLFIAILILTSPTPLNMFEVVLKCPTSVRKWKGRAEELQCDKQVGRTFHCILASNGSLIEDCLVNRPFRPGQEGCPSVSIQDGNVFLDAENSFCPMNNSFCPASKNSYRSDELYLFPICFKRISERYQYDGEYCEEQRKVTERVEDHTKSAEGITDKSVIGDSTKAFEEVCQRCTVSWILFSLSFLTNVILSAGVIIFFLKKKNNNLRTESMKKNRESMIPESAHIPLS